MALTEEQQGNRDAWLEALESGEYEQCKGSLSVVWSRQDKTKFCCLGVGCEVLRKRGYPIRIVSYGQAARPSYLFGEDSSTSRLPYGIPELLGLRDVRGEPNPHEGIALSTLNDRGKSFKEIAKALRTGAYDAS